MGKLVFFTGQNVVPQGGAEMAKSGRCRNPYPIPEGHAKTALSDIFLKPGKSPLLRKHRKVQKITNFRTFLSPSKSVISHRV